jgi:transposase
MAGRSAERLILPRKLLRRLARLARSTKAECRLVERAKMIVLACEGKSNADIARQVGCSEQTVRKWRGRMEREKQLTSLRDNPRSGWPAQVPTDVRCEIIKLACDRPKEQTFRQTWTLDLFCEAVLASTDWKLSRSEVHRILKCDGLRPHYVKMWLHSPDPEFRAKVSKVCDLYVHPPPNATVLCVDEKPGMLARERKHPTRYSRVGNAVRYEFEYIRHGTSTLIAAFNTQSGEVFGQTRRRTAEGILAFLEAIAERYPTGPIYIVWDNLNIHKGQRWAEFNAQHGGRFHFVYTPLHASWVNQVELWFSILQRRLLKYGSFRSVDHLNRAVLGFIEHWNLIEGHPFRWTFRGVRNGKTRHRLAA